MFVTIGQNNIVIGNPVVSILLLTSAKMYGIKTSQLDFASSGIFIAGTVTTDWVVQDFGDYIGYKFVAKVYTELGEGKVTYLINPDDLKNIKVPCPELN
jgi:hypothetical protein